ncbi:hypothetical protein LV469_07095 [Peptoniphilus sp. GNH]|nr:hypothetical protein HMPREF3189_00756 [Clostridiales bacterium KA00134]UHR02403.1 hypothetical protein LV469_07095 [Peptoniphilus sp. GNH]
MNRKFGILVLICLLVLVGCKKKNDIKTPDTADKAGQTDLANGGETKEESGDGKNTNAKTDNQAEAEEPAENEETAPQTEEPKTPKETLKAMMDASDYISRLRVNQESDGSLTPIFIEDYKGDLSLIEYTLPKTLVPNQEYLVFLKDGQDGKLEPTDPVNSYTQIAQESDSSVKMVEAAFNNSQKTSKRISD